MDFKVSDMMRFQCLKHIVHSTIYTGFNFFNRFLSKKENCNVRSKTILKGAFLWDDLDKGEGSKIVWIIVHQSNQ